MILVDTSALVALARERDEHHGAALRILGAIEARGEDLLLTSYVLLETFALLHRRHGRAVATRVSEETRSLPFVAVDRELHDRALADLAELPRRVSLVDAVSFRVMRDRGLTEAFAFDPDFERAGFELSEAPAR